MKIPLIIPTPEWLHFLQLIISPTKYMDACQKRYGDNFTVWGRKAPLVYLSHPKALQTIFNADSSQVEDLGGGNEFLRIFLGDNSVLMLTGKRHQRQRQLLTPPFHGERLKQYGKLICEITEQVMRQWPLARPFIIRQSMQAISLRVILRLVFGLDEGERYQKLQQLLTKLIVSFSTPINSSMLFVSWLRWDLGLGAWSPWGRFLYLLEQVDGLIYAEIRHRREQLDISRNDILTLMMMATDEAGEAMTDEELRDDLMTLLMAGHETTASALVWALYWIDRQPEVRDKLLAELATLGNKSDPSAIARLPYLSAVCSETLRIYPIVMTAFYRVVRSPLKVMEYELEPGTLILPSIYMTHQKEDIYPEPKRFKPERFLERQFSPYEYLPFGGGNRRCMGMAFAQLEMKLVLATILSQFQVTLSDHRQIQPVRRGFTIAPPANMQMTATPAFATSLRSNI